MQPGVLQSRAFGSPVALRRTVTNRYNNDVSTADTIAIMRALVRQFAHDPTVLMANDQAMAQLPQWASERDMACAIFYWVRGTVRFVEDEQLLYSELGVQPEELDKELLLPPPVLLGMPVPMGDCDDFSLLTACMAIEAGLVPYFVTVAADANEPYRFSHIYVCVKLQDEGSHLCLDAGNRYSMIPPGWEPQNVFRKTVWPV